MENTVGRKKIFMMKFLIPFVVVATLTFILHVERSVDTETVNMSPTGSIHTPEYPVQLLILSYMRSGTSFLGQIFDQNKDGLYVFEPLSTICEHMIPNFRPLTFLNGSTVFPGTSCEVFAEKIIKSYLTCKIREIDKSTLTQSWMSFGRKTKDFSHCMRTSEQDGCIDQFTAVCKHSQIVVLKTIRTRLQTVLSILRSLPRMKVIHLVRDPRAIIQSRKLMGEYYHRDVLKTGKQVCGDMRRDIRTLKLLKNEFPGRLLQMRYEDIAQNPLVKADTIYSFLNLKMPQDVVKWIKQNTNANADDKAFLSTSRANSRKTASKWRKGTPWAVVSGMQQACGDVLNDLRYGISPSENILRNFSIPLVLT